MPLSQNGLRDRPNISISIYGQVLGSNLRFQKPEKIPEVEELRVSPTHDSPSLYWVMVNSPGILSVQNAYLVLQTRQRNPQYC